MIYVAVAVFALLVGILITLLITNKSGSRLTKNNIIYSEPLIQKPEVLDKSIKENIKKEDWQNKIIKAREEGYKEGRETGYAEGKREGYNIGKKDGLLKGIEECFKLTMPEINAEHVKIDIEGAFDETGYLFTIDAPWMGLVNEYVNEDEDEDEDWYEGSKFVFLPYYIDDRNRITFKEIENMLVEKFGQVDKEELKKFWQDIKTEWLNKIKKQVIQE